MKNIVTASIQFSFKGKTFSPSIVLELDDFLRANKSLTNLYHLIASANKIDHYSYEYEMMQAETITFSDAQGLVANFIVEGVLDSPAFLTAWREQQLNRQLQDIAQRHLGVEDLQQQPELMAALKEAFHNGQKSLPD